MNQFRSMLPPFPPVIKNLMIFTGLVFLAQQTLGQTIERSIIDMFALHTIQSPFFRPHQLITYIFLHGSFDHILYNMLFLWIYGSALEIHWGSKRFLSFYIVCGIGAALVHMLVLYFELAQYADAVHNAPAMFYQQAQDALHSPGYPLNQATLGASGAVFGCMAAMAYLFPNSQIYFFMFPFPIKVKWVVLGYMAIELFSGISPSAGDMVAHWAHLGGGLMGFLLVLYWNRTDRRNFY